MHTDSRQQQNPSPHPDAHQPKRSVFSKLLSFCTKKRPKLVTRPVFHPDEQSFFAGFSLKGEPIYKNSQAWAGHQEWLKTHQSFIAETQGVLVPCRTSTEVKLVEMPSRAQTRYAEKLNRELIARQKKSPSYQRQQQLCRELFANLPAWEDAADYADNEEFAKPAPVPLWEQQQAAKARRQREQRRTGLPASPDHHDLFPVENTPCEQPLAPSPLPSAPMDDPAPTVTENYRHHNPPASWGLTQKIVDIKKYIGRLRLANATAGLSWLTQKRVCGLICGASP